MDQDEGVPRALRVNPAAILPTRVLHDVRLYKNSVVALAVLLTRMDYDSVVRDLSVADLAYTLDVNERTAYRALAQLHELGYITTRPQYNVAAKKRATNHYLVNLAAELPAEHDRHAPEEALPVGEPALAGEWEPEGDEAEMVDPTVPRPTGRVLARTNLTPTNLTPVSGRDPETVDNDGPTNLTPVSGGYKLGFSPNLTPVSGSSVGGEGGGVVDSDLELPPPKPPPPAPPASPGPTPVEVARRIFSEAAPGTTPPILELVQLIEVFLFEGVEAEDLVAVAPKVIAPRNPEGWRIELRRLEARRPPPERRARPECAAGCSSGWILDEAGDPAERCPACGGGARS